ncbi:MAG: fumarylacetoacetate hydrolase family protein [Bacteroidetes bacterium]|jgi:acylpyruvate hydrolase|nr:fumarylacetoacetate hydrolase family protein [Bacteroidota bacterium]MBT6685721.1 fumarylacetoacetate hydrolase family protein [Bacteroidota bacterium]MBT7143516.1 fumarylacetoacetate hydrolase family protein [Bacteroidota bacterium]MBT7492241.1 fumarylacetoacetate hydrolase family protein [Bacteroidota bacterium]
MKIIAIGRNYIEHAKELNNPVPKEPIFFLKPETAILRKNKPFYIPEFSNEIHYELEVVLRIDKIGKHVDKKFAHRYYSEIGLGIDFTARDLQSKCKKNGHPWEIAKAFDNSAPISDFVSKNNFPDLQNINFSLTKNETVVQDGNTKHMIFDFDEIIAYVSKFVSLKIGDMIFTGTPAGVGKVEIGDRLTAFLEDKKLMDFEIK